MVGAKEYTRAEVIEDFLSVAFSDIPWNADAGEEDRKKLLNAFAVGNPNPKSKIDKKVHQLNSNPAGTIWLDEHIHYIGKGPIYKRDVITKWNDKVITIGFGVPYSARIHKANANLANLKLYYQSFERQMEKGEGVRIKKLFSEIRERLPALSQSINKTIKLMHPRDVWDNSPVFARIRIIPSEQPSFRSWLAQIHAPSPYAYDSRFLNGILFQSYARSYFDGYLLPKASHDLDIAVCIINPRMDSVFYEAMLTECLVRSLGLPAMTKNKNSILSHWHSNPQSLFKNTASYKIGDRYVDPRKTKQAVLEKEENIKTAKATEQIYQNKTYIVLDEDRLESFRNVTEYDQAMLSILYCKDIKPGMSKKQVRDVLSKSKLCFKALYTGEE